MDLKELKEILQILEEKEITEFELEEEGMKLRIRKSAVATNHAAPPTAVAAPLIATVLPPLAAVPVVGSPQAAAPAPASAPPAPSVPEEVGLVVVKSPIVGTFYQASDPNSPPFVNVGDKVRVGQIVCIIEAMKLMNEIEAEVAGEIVRIHQENGQPVQFGDPLFSVRPS